MHRGGQRHQQGYRAAARRAGRDRRDPAEGYFNGWRDFLSESASDAPAESELSEDHQSAHHVTTLAIVAFLIQDVRDPPPELLLRRRLDMLSGYARD